jgi:glycosyltransferase involved in cell wall biosynthesis
MHIALWSPAWPLEKFQNGIITYVHWMKREFEEQGHRVSVFTGKLDSSVEEPGIYQLRRGRWDEAVHRVARRWIPVERAIFGFSAAIATEISRVHRRHPIDIIEMEESFGWFADVGKLTSLPLLVKLHGPAFLSLVGEELNTSFGRTKVAREGRALKLATAIASPCEITLQQTIERYRLAPKHKAHIVNPLTMDSSTPHWRLDACDRNTILFVGRFDLRKGADVALKAFLLVLKDHPNLKLIFVGPDSGLSTADGGRIYFNVYCDSLYPPELRARVEFRGPLANHEVTKLRAQSMVTVVASRWENQGYTVLEAMFQGCPVVSTDAGGCPESVINGVTGRLARSEDPEDFAAQLRAMIRQPEAAEAMGKAARRHVLELHSVNRVAAVSLELYERVISNHAAEHQEH